jgi:hypothetical protein
MIVLCQKEYQGYVCTSRNNIIQTIVKDQVIEFFIDKVID